MNVYVVKHGQHDNIEQFDPIKLHSSIKAACLAVRSLEGEAHLVAQHVCERVIDWINTKTEVTSADIRRVATDHLHIYHPEAAYVYEGYKVMV